MKTFKQYLTENKTLPHWPKTMEELEAAFNKFSIDEETGEVLIDFDDVEFHNDLSVSVKGNVRIHADQFETHDCYLPFKFKNVTGKFSLFSDYNSRSFKSLVGCPDSCDSFEALYGSFATLEGMPKEIKTNCLFNSCRNIKTLEGLPQNNYHLKLCWIPKLTSLKGLPREVKSLEIKSIPCFDESQFQYLPEKIGFELNFYDNEKLKTLKDIHKYVKHCEQIDLIGQQITGNILGLMEIDGLEEVLFDNMKSFDDDDIDLNMIINKHLGDRDIFEFQQELINLGLKKYAQL